MSSVAIEAGKPKFVFGRRPAEILPASFDKQVKEILRREAQLSSVVHYQTFPGPDMRRKAELAALVRTYKPRHLAPFERAEPLERVTQLGDLLDELSEGIAKRDAATAAIAAQRDLGSIGSTAYTTANACVAALKKPSVELKNIVKSVGVPKVDEKPDKTVQNVDATASLLIAATNGAGASGVHRRQWHGDDKGAAQ